MTSSEHATTTNVAGDGAVVGVQVGVVHGDLTYVVPPGATAEETYEVGVRHLDNGTPEKARELIYEAVVRGHITSEVRFHQLLALLSGRTLQMLSDADLRALEDARTQRPVEGTDDHWVRGIKAIGALLDNLSSSKTHTKLDPTTLDRLDDDQRRKIIRHLEMLLQGPMRDRAWDDLMILARDRRRRRNRDRRAWKFFHPEPAGPRVLNPPAVDVSLGVYARAIAAAVVLGVAAAYCGILVIRRADLVAVIALAASVAGGYLAAVNGVEWRFRTERLREKENILRAPREQRNAPPGGFAGRIDRQFERYFHKYVPPGVDRNTWLVGTAGIRRHIRDEVVVAYRETRIKANQVAWLTRYRVSEVRRGWQDGSLWDYRERFRTRAGTKIGTVGGTGLLAVGGVRAMVGAIQASPLRASGAVVLILVGGCAAATSWMGIAVAKRRHTDELAESEHLLAGCQGAHQRWLDKLSDRPSDNEMADWLESDRTILIGQALRQYRLAASSVIAQAFLEARAPGSQQARVKSGPWRYSRYRIVIFLLTPDGVRQVESDLDFVGIAYEHRERTNYRFDAVASVRVVIGSREARTFDLTLVNGQEIALVITGPDQEEGQEGEEAGSVADLTADAAGLPNTLHILEGVAAEGKAWIQHERMRSRSRVDRLRSAVHGLVE